MNILYGRHLSVSGQPEGGAPVCNFYVAKHTSKHCCVCGIGRYILDVFKRLVVSHRLVWPPEYEISINIVRNTAKTSKHLEKTKNIKI